MMVIFVSQCEKRALKRTRRVLDTFAERIGDNTWRTLITAEGLKAVRKLLQKTATKSTAVSCHWIRSRHRSELLWIVGNKSKFNHEGIVPVHHTSLPLLEAYKEHDWHHLGLIQALATLAALLHDWGKANAHFQEKLTKRVPQADPLRHEWVSVMLLGAFVSLDPDTWMQRFAQGRIDEGALKKALKIFEFSHFQTFPFSAQAVAWLILTHHRLPTYTQSATEIRKEWDIDEPMEEFEIFFAYVDADWGYRNDMKKPTLRFPKGFLGDADVWIEKLSRWAGKLQRYEETLEALQQRRACRVVLHHARIALMLGDYGYSSSSADANWPRKCELFANTDKNGNPKQRLDEHLCGVAELAKQIAYRFPYLERALPRAEGVRSLLRSSPAPYAWQDKAASIVWEHYGKQGLREGFFAVNMASTGMGKTVANAKMMQALHKDRSLHYVLALGLRTLTLQTGDEYRSRIGLEEDQMAVLIGSKAMVRLHQDGMAQEQEEPYDASGSESIEKPLVEGWVDFDNESTIKGLDTVLKSAKEHALLYAPVLVATIDHLMGAVDTPKGGGHLLPSLRLLGSDLVIDEIDDFTGSDLIAIGRLVFLAGMLGRRVMISSATIPPDLAEGYFHAYTQGWRLFAATREVPNRVHACWVDEFGTRIHAIANDEKADETFSHLHRCFIDKRLKHLGTLPPRRKAVIVPVGSETQSESSYFDAIWQAMVAIHTRHHTVDPSSGKRVSFGVVRMANIGPCVALVRHLCRCDTDGVTLRVMAYHSNQVLLLRHAQERYLDSVLKRKEKEGEPPAAFADETVRRHIDEAEGEDVIFAVVATPVEEVGRDHDFDWAVIEPSSWRSVIQMAGRVKRHRVGEVHVPNVAIMRYNLKAWLDGDKPHKAYFFRPGFEDGDIRLHTHDMQRLVDTSVIEKRLDAAWRVAKPDPIHPTEKLVDLEHCVVQEALTRYDLVGPAQMEGWVTGYWHLTALPLYVHPFRAGAPSVKLFLHYYDESDRYKFSEINSYGKLVPREQAANNIRHLNELCRRFWLDRDYNTLVEELAQKKNQRTEEITRIFGELSFTEYEGTETLYYHDQLGLFREK
jgi:CRISPR-associated endonuclease/helicase Cas3